MALSQIWSVPSATCQQDDISAMLHLRLGRARKHLMNTENSTIRTPGENPVPYGLITHQNGDHHERHFHDH